MNTYRNNTEEDIKVKVILPFLESLGFGKDEMKFEQSFYLRLGRFTSRIDTEKQITTASPRLDILVTINGVNYFIIEAKSDCVDISDQDKMQAISYARLVHPMAPFAIVTNGKSFKIYDTLSGLELSETFNFKGYQINSDLEVLYNEAFEYFIGYSTENLTIFCNSQYIEGAKTVVGSTTDRNKKFIPEMYCCREDLDKAFLSFLESDKPVFAIVGESGSGKTCEMCGLAMKYQKQHPSLFYRGINLVNGITKTIASDFNWEFSGSYDEVSVFKKLARIVKDKMIVFIDGMDECPFPAKVEELGGFAAKVKDRKIKIVISCKKYPWDRFLSKNGIPTELSQLIFQVKGENCYQLKGFSEREFYNLVSNYRQFYDFHGRFEDRVLKECRQSPFLLRLFFEIAVKSGAEHLTLSTREFYQEYFNQLLQCFEVAEREVAVVQMKGIAACLAVNGVDSVDMDTVRKHLSLSVTDSFSHIFLENNILESVSDGGDTFISFYFQHIRDYIVAYMVKRWDKGPVDAVISDYSHGRCNAVIYESIKLFYSLSDESIQQIFDGELRLNASQYLNLYTQVISEHFSNLKSKLQPFTDKEIGFIAEYDMRRNMLAAYGFREINNGYEKVKFVPVDGSFVAKTSNLSELLGGSGMHWTSSSNGFATLSVNGEVINNEIVKQLQNLVEQCDLNEDHCYYLSLEKVLGCLHKLGFFREKNRFGVQHCMPIKYADIEYNIRFKHAYSYYRQELIDTRRRNGAIKETWSGSTVSYSVSFSAEDHKYLNQVANEAANNPEFNLGYASDVDSRNIEYKLNEGLNVVKKKWASVSDLIVPDSDYHTRYIYGGYECENLIGFLENLYTLHLQEYSALIDSNFPTLKGFFRLYSLMPITIFLRIEYNREDPRIDIMYCKNETVVSNEVVVVEKDALGLPDDDHMVYRDNIKYSCIFWSRTRLNSIFCSGNVRSQFEFPFSVLRGLVYRTLQSEMKEVIAKFKQLYGVGG